MTTGAVPSLRISPLPEVAHADVQIVHTRRMVGREDEGPGDVTLVLRRVQGRWCVAELGQSIDISGLAAGVPTWQADAVSLRLVNAHTHLDLSSYPPMQTDFPSFMDQMVGYRRTHPKARGVHAAAHGLQQMLNQQVAAVGDIVAREPVLLAHLQSSPVPGVVYWEVVCTAQAAAPATIAALASRVPAWKRLQRRGGPIVGLSPQSPYLVCKDVLQHLAKVSMAEGLPLQIHVAESPAESEFFRTGGGALGETLRRCGFRVPPSPDSLGFAPGPALTPIRYLAQLGVLDASPTLVHCVNVTDEDIRIIAEHRCPVVTCPRSNRHLDCGVFPWDAFTRAGVTIALATDSAATAHDLDLGAEVSAAMRQHGPSLDLGRVLEWSTSGARHALGRPVPTIQAGLPVESLSFTNARRVFD